MSSVLLKIEDGVGYITLNRPDKFNAVTRELAFAFQDALKQCEADKSVRAILVTGSGRAFCAGQDLAELLDPNSKIELSKIIAEHFNPIVKLMRGIEKPIITAINGAAAGAGANLALCGDIVVACESAYFMQAFSQIGLIPDSGGTYILSRLVGFQKASAFMMLADKISAQEAERVGMIYKVVEDEALEATTTKIAQKLANMPTKALGLIKRALNASLSNDLNEQLDVEGELQAIAAQTKDFKEGVSAFVQKRKPKFVGE